MIPQGGPSSNVAIFANQVNGGVSVYSLNYAASSKFATLTAADTVGRTSKPLYNSDTTWTLGAFNRMNSSNPLDFSWGMYDMVSHNVIGDSLYLVKTPAGAYKLWIQKYVSAPTDSIRYEFRIASFNGSGDTTIKIYRKDGYVGKLFGYYNAATRTTLDREPAMTNWDVLFTRYYEQITAGSVTAMYNVTGVLAGPNTEVAEVFNVKPDTVTLAGKTFVKTVSTIGSDWKSYNMSANVYVMDSMRTYFVKSKNTNEYYQVVFTGFTGASAGKTYFRKRLATLGVKNVEANAPAAFAIVPNPAVTDADVMVDAVASGAARLFITDIAGRTVQSSAIQINKGLNAFRVQTGNLPAGTYMVTVTDGSWKLTQKLSVQH
jgi:hypothetical protein